MYKNNKYITTIIIILIGIASYAGIINAYQITNEVIEEISNIQDNQFFSKLQNGKYQQVDTYTKDNVQYEVHIYMTPNDQEGYQVYSKGNGFKYSTGEGPEEQDRSYSIELPINNYDIGSSTKI